VTCGLHRAVRGIDIGDSCGATLRARSDSPWFGHRQVVAMLSLICWLGLLPGALVPKVDP